MLKRAKTPPKSGKNQYLLILFLLLNLQFSYAQQVVPVKGKVTDERGLPLPGVSVIIKGTQKGTSTDNDGNYSVRVATGSPLVFHYIGYKRQEHIVGAATTLNVKLVPESNNMQEVIVVGYGTQRKANTTNAQARVTSKDIDERPITRIEAALAGQLPGVNVRTTTGEPGADMQIRVRGTGSVNADNEPLYVVDGIPVDNLRGINPADVESIDVLKDASSAAIYGSRGSNGVVIVTTKSGKNGPPQISLSVRTGIQSLEKKVDVLSPEEWIDFTQEGINNAWVAYGVSNKFPASASDPVDYRIQQYNLVNPSRQISQASEQPTMIPDPRWATAEGRASLAFIDWQDAYYRAAPIQDYQLTVTGGSGDVIYNISAGYLNQDGIASFSNVKRGTLRANFQVRIAKRIKLGLTIAPSLEWQKGVNIDGKDNTSANILKNAPIAEKDAGINSGVMPYAIYAWAGTLVSPIAYARESTNTTKRDRLNSSMYLNVDLIKGMQLQITGAVDNYGNINQQFYPTSVDRDWASNTPGSLSRSRRTTARNSRYLVQGTLNYNKSINKEHNFNGLLGYAFEHTDSEQTWQEGTKLPNDWSYIYDTNTFGVVSRNYIPLPGKTALLSYFGRLQYDYKGKYLLSGSLRTDGSSKFAAGHQFGLFPAISAGWRVSEENFMKNVQWISDLKLRGSFGITGNNRIGDNRQYVLLGNSGYSTGGTAVAGYAPSNLIDPNLTWETNQSFNYGVDMSIFKGRIQFSADYYIKKTLDLLLNAPVSSQTGFASYWINAGDIKNKGVELQLSTQNIMRKNFKWSTTFNLSFNKNKVLKLGTDNTPIPQGFSNLTQLIEVGQPLSYFKMYKAVGVYKDQADVDNSPHMTTTKPGDVKYEDTDGNGVINDVDRTFVGSPQPKFDFGFVNNFSYKRFDLSIVTNAQTGGYTYAILGRALDKPGQGYRYNIMDRWANRWRSATNPGDGETPSMNSTTASLYDTRWLYKSDYIRIRNITAGYNFKKVSWVKNARIYVSVENPLKWDYYYGGYSPEASNDAGGDFGGYPIARTFSIGFNVSL